MIKPARPVTLAFEPGLAERILEDITRQANPLPILEFTLSELWWHHQGGLLRHAVYEQIGGVTGAMVYNAERVFQALTPKQQTLARRILTRLVFISPDGHEVSRPLRLPDLWPSLQSTELDRVQGVVRVLVGAKLLTLKRDEITGEERVQTREILACHWPRWQKWVAEEHEFWHWRQHLNILMSGWERGETDEKALLQGAELIEAEEWLTKRPDNLDSEGRVYIWQSLAHRNGEQDRRWLVGIGLTVLLILGIAFILIQEMAYLLI